MVRDIEFDFRGECEVFGLTIEVVLLLLFITVYITRTSRYIYIDFLQSTRGVSYGVIIMSAHNINSPWKQQWTGGGRRVEAERYFIDFLIMVLCVCGLFCFFFSHRLFLLLYFDVAPPLAIVAWPTNVCEPTLSIYASGAYDNAEIGGGLRGNYPTVIEL